MKTADSRDDVRHMRHALRLARRGLGRTAPNPAVGCVIVRDGLTVGRGWTAPGGRPHAETMALNEAGSGAEDATAFVTLEPCSHHGQTPPCARSLIDAGITRVVIAMTDPDSRVDGRGIAMLRSAGIQVRTDVCEKDAGDLQLGFVLNRTAGRPLVSLKVASSLDGRIATAAGESKWITGPEARASGHMLRATHDAILIGAGTAVADDPELTCRLPGMADRSPVRIVLDRHLRLSLSGRLARTAARVPLIIYADPAVDPERKAALAEAGADIRHVTADSHGRPDAKAVLQDLAADGVTRLLLEGGGGIAASFLGAGLVDRIFWYRAGLAIGGDGRPALAPLQLDRLADAPRFQRMAAIPLGDDLLETWRRQA
ncbi:MAG: bifunctional diaminohydroxyphosphoribosylaminopyrimidine deaminase/5-amino-6-(5-phosphoribosylamino)uracil reductase RibD [Minwuia sp.]|nr:bifunctional diaminohydroxyphosphoribosylaminopyrimidine deaminase/5-amino-6-(5-phosphoribosylamino)uracil reductase RibD [Minwuia sp.]